jgi:hypothetical protein
MRPRPAGLVLAMPFALFIAASAACGSSSPGVFHPAGATVAAAGPPSSLAGPAPFPGKLTFRFDPLPPDPQQAALVSADRAFIVGYYYAIYTRGKSRNYASYIGDRNVELSVAGNIAQQVAGHRGYAGVTTYFNTTVQPMPGYRGEQQVTYCVDESALQHTDIRTGRVVPRRAPTDHQYYLESDLLAKDRRGAWQVVGTLVTYYPNGQARECKP